MPRGSRLDAPGALHHVMVRGIEGRSIFADDVDRQDWVDRLATIGPGDWPRGPGVGAASQSFSPLGPDGDAAAGDDYATPPNRVRRGVQSAPQAGRPSLPESVQVHLGGRGALPAGSWYGTSTSIPFGPK